MEDKQDVTTTMLHSGDGGPAVTSVVYSKGESSNDLNEKKDVYKTRQNKKKWKRGEQRLGWCSQDDDLGVDSFSYSAGCGKVKRVNTYEKKQEQENCV